MLVLLLSTNVTVQAPCAFNFVIYNRHVHSRVNKSIVKYTAEKWKQRLKDVFCRYFVVFVNREKYIFTLKYVSGHLSWSFYFKFMLAIVNSHIYYPYPLYMWHDPREMSNFNFNSHFLKPLSRSTKCFTLMQTPLQLDIWLQSYEEFVNAKKNIKQRNWNTVFANISKLISLTSESFFLIMSH